MCGLGKRLISCRLLQEVSSPAAREASPVLVLGFKVSANLVIGGPARLTGYSKGSQGGRSKNGVQTSIGQIRGRKRLDKTKRE